MHNLINFKSMLFFMAEYIYGSTCWCLIIEKKVRKSARSNVLIGPFIVPTYVLPPTDHNPMKLSSLFLFLVLTHTAAAAAVVQPSRHPIGPRPNASAALIFGMTFSGAGERRRRGSSVSAAIEPADLDSPPPPAPRPTLRPGGYAVLTSSAAALAIESASSFAESESWPVSICVSDPGGHPIASRRLDGAFPASYEISVEKARTAAMFRKDTSALESSVNVDGGSARSALLSAPYVLMGGGLPVFVEGICVGSVGVSGVTPDQDKRVAEVAVAILTSPKSSKL